MGFLGFSLSTLGSLPFRIALTLSLFPELVLSIPFTFGIFGTLTLFPHRGGEVAGVVSLRFLLSLDHRSDIVTGVGLSQGIYRHLDPLFVFEILG